jgi:hypothetical protein
MRPPVVRGVLGVGAGAMGCAAKLPPVPGKGGPAGRRSDDARALVHQMAQVRQVIVWVDPGAE